MEEIKKQVSAARRRMVLQQFLAIATWSLFAALLVAAVGLAVPKLWVLTVDASLWTWSWLGGALGVGLAIAAVWTYLVRWAPIDAAIEIDRRFRLKERVSSALSLAADEVDSEAGQALVDDAVRRVRRIDVRDRFPLRANWRGLMPLVPVAVIFFVLFIDDATPPNEAQAATGSSTEAQRVKKSAEALKKRLARVKKEAHEDGLEDTDLLFKQLQQGIDDVANKSDVDRKRALVKFNDMAKALQERRKALGGADKMRQQLNRLKNLQAGPADKIAEAIKEGDFQKALDELKNLQEKIANRQLNDEEKKQLAEQLKQLQDKLQDMVDAHRQAKQDLEEEIKRLKAAGDLQQAGKLQRQLDQLNAMNNPMSRLGQMAESLNQCRQCLQDGNAQNAAAALDDLAQNLQELQNQLDELETLDQVLDEIAMCKEAMNCGMCNGQGCEACMGGMGQGDRMGQRPGMGLGPGQGQGERPEQRTDTGMYESRVRGKLQPGEAVRTGSAGGPNRAGKSREEVKELIGGRLREDPDPLVDVHLPRKERQHAKQYFQRFRKGE